MNEWEWERQEEREGGVKKQITPPTLQSPPILWKLCPIYYYIYFHEKNFSFSLHINYVTLTLIFKRPWPSEKHVLMVLARRSSNCLKQINFMTLKIFITMSFNSSKLTILTLAVCSWMTMEQSCDLEQGGLSIAYWTEIKKNIHTYVLNSLNT